MNGAPAFDPVQSIISTANLYGVDPDLALKVAHQESGINPNVRDSSAGAIGVMQLMPATARQLGVNPRDPMQNIDGGVRYLKQLQDQFGGDPILAAGAYNAGPGRMRQVLAGRASLPAETQGYIDRISRSPISARALGYTAASPSSSGPSAAQFIANPAGGSQSAQAEPDPAASLPPGFVLDTPGAQAAPDPAAASLPPGFVLDDAPTPPDAKAAAPAPKPAPAAPAGPTYSGTVPVEDGSVTGALKQLGYHAAASAVELPTLAVRGIGAAAHGVNWLAEKAGIVDPNANANADANLASIQASAGGPPALTKVADAIRAATPAPHGQFERDAGAIGDFAPAALGGEGTAIRRVAQVVVPAVASQEGADAAAQAGLPPGMQAAIKAAIALPLSVATASPTAGPVNAPVAAAERLGVTVPKFVASDGHIAPQLAQGAKAVPFAGGPIYAATDKLSSGLQKTVDAIAPNITPDIAGAAASRGIVQNIKTDAPAAVSKAYTAAENLMTQNPGARVPLANTAATMQQIMGERANAGLPPWSGTMNLLANAATSPQGIDYAGAKLLRTALSERTPDQLIAEGIDPTEAKRLYGPLTQDLESAVQAAGGQPALNAWRDANTLAQTTAAQREKLYGIVGVNGDEAPEAVFARLAQMAGSKASADINSLRLARNAMGSQAWRQVGSAIISRLGRDPQGNFSPDRFLGATGYSGLSQAAKTILFTPQQRSALDDLATVSNAYSAKLSKFANTSRTAHVSKAAESLAAMWAAITHPATIPAAVGGLASTYGVARYLASPAVVQKAVWLGRQQLAGGAARTVLGSTPAFSP